MYRWMREKICCCCFLLSSSLAFCLRVLGGLARWIPEEFHLPAIDIIGGLITKASYSQKKHIEMVFAEKKHMRKSSSHRLKLKFVMKYFCQHKADLSNSEALTLKDLFSVFCRTEKKSLGLISRSTSERFKVNWSAIVLSFKAVVWSMR